MNTLLLASQSSVRKKLLEESGIPFETISQNADESKCNWSLPFTQLLESIAISKMMHAKIPSHYNQDSVFVLTADTMGCMNDGTILSKPHDKNDAIRMIRIARQGGFVGTAFCIERKKKGHQGIWQTQQRIVQTVRVTYQFDLPDQWIERYFEHKQNYLSISGAIDVQGYGAQFLHTINGSYTGLLGLPLYEVRIALKQLGFFNA